MAPSPASLMTAAMFYRDEAEVRLSLPGRLDRVVNDLELGDAPCRMVIAQPWPPTVAEIKSLRATAGRKGSATSRPEIVWAVSGHDQDAAEQAREAFRGHGHVKVLAQHSDRSQVAALGGRPDLDLGHPQLRDYLWSKIAQAEMGQDEARPIHEALKALQKKPFTLAKAESKWADFFRQAEFPYLFCRSEAVQRIKRQILAAAEADLNVVVSGPLGSGREALARFVHYFGARRDKPFAVIDCAAMDPDRLRSDLFGHVKGAYSWAHQDESGLFQENTGGTLVLAHTERIPPEVQFQMAAALRRRSFLPMSAGRGKEQPLDLRVVAVVERPALGPMDRPGCLVPELRAQVAELEIELPGLAEADMEPMLLYLVSWHDPDGRLPGSRFKKMSSEALAALRTNPGMGPLDLRRLVRRTVMVNEPGLFDVRVAGSGQPRGMLPASRPGGIVPLASHLREHVRGLAARYPDLPMTRLAKEFGISLNTLRKYLKTS